MRILIIGSPGTGKTTLANKLKKSLELPVIHLDDCYWQKNWQRTDKATWHSIVENISRESKWIIDGNYLETLDVRIKHADIVIYLDYPIYVCLLRSLHRAYKRLLGDSESLPRKIREDSNYRPKLSFKWKFIALILFFKIKQKPKIIQLLQKYQPKLFIFRNSNELNNFLSNFQLEKLMPIS